MMQSKQSVRAKEFIEQQKKFIKQIEDSIKTGEATTLDEPTCLERYDAWQAGIAVLQAATSAREAAEQVESTAADAEQILFQDYMTHCG